MLHFAQPYWFCWRGIKSVAGWREKLWTEETERWRRRNHGSFLPEALTSPWLHLQKQQPSWNKWLALMLLKKNKNTANYSLSISAAPTPILCLPQSLSVPDFLTLSFDFHSARWTLSEYQGTVSALNRVFHIENSWKSSWKRFVICRWKLKCFFDRHDLNGNIMAQLQTNN